MKFDIKKKKKVKMKRIHVRSLDQQTRATANNTIGLS